MDRGEKIIIKNPYGFGIATQRGVEGAGTNDVNKFLKGTHRNDGAGVFTRACSDGAREDGFKMIDR